MRDPRYDILFEPMAIGPVTAKNRFYQVPHCNGGGYRDPSAAAEMRGIKAQGGWGVVFTEQCELHHSSEITPYIELRLWDDRDIPHLRNMASKMKEHGALAGIQLAYSVLTALTSIQRRYHLHRQHCQSEPSPMTLCKLAHWTNKILKIYGDGMLMLPNAQSSQVSTSFAYTVLMALAFSNIF